MAMNLHISLRNKILSEYCEFRKSQEQLKPKDVYENAYEIVIKQNIRDLICDETVALTSEQKIALKLSNNTLDEIYEDWLDKDTENLADIPYTITETADRLMSNVSSKSQLIWRGFLAENKLDLNIRAIKIRNSTNSDIFEIKEVIKDEYTILYNSNDNCTETLTSVDELRSVYEKALDKYSGKLIETHGKEVTGVLLEIPNRLTPFTEFRDFCPDWRERGSNRSYVKEVWDNFLKDHDLPDDTTKISFHATSTYYVGGIDENGHERKDNYSEYAEDDSFYLFDYDNELVIRYGFESELDFPIEDTIIDPSILSKDYEDVLEKYSTELSKQTYNYIDVCITKSDGSETHEDFESFCPDWEERAPIITSSRQR